MFTVRLDRKRYTGVVDTVLRYSNVLHLHKRVCHKIGDTMVRTSRFTSAIRFLYTVQSFRKSPGLLHSSLPFLLAPLALPLPFRSSDLP